MISTKKTISMLAVFAMLMTFLTPITSIAQTGTSKESNSITVNVSEEEVAEATKLVNAIDELNANLNMNDLSKNSETEIRKLSKEAQDFYYLYKDQSNGKATKEDALNLMNEALETEDTKLASSKDTIQKTGYDVISEKKYYLSNQNVKDFVKQAGVNGSFWGLMTAIAKAFKKSPTYVTGLIVAIPALGAAVLNACNKYDKGVVITDLRVGATHNFSCTARK